MLEGAKMVQFPLVLLLKVVITEEKLPNVPLVRIAARVLKSELELMRSVMALPLCARAVVASKVVARAAEDLKNIERAQNEDRWDAP